MKLKNGQKWYPQDLDNYNEEFLKEIILDLVAQQGDVVMTWKGEGK